MNISGRVKDALKSAGETATDPVELWYAKERALEALKSPENWGKVSKVAAAAGVVAGAGELIAQHVGRPKKEEESSSQKWAARFALAATVAPTLGSLVGSSPTGANLNLVSVETDDMIMDDTPGQVDSSGPSLAIIAEQV